MKHKPLSIQQAIKLITNELAITDKEVRKAFNIVTAGLTSILKQGHIVRLPNLGDFRTHDMSEKVGISPKTGKPAIIKAHKQIKFKSSSVLKKAINEPSK